MYFNSPIIVLMTKSNKKASVIRNNKIILIYRAIINVFNLRSLCHSLFHIVVKYRQ